MSFPDVGWNPRHSEIDERFVVAMVGELIAARSAKRLWSEATQLRAQTLRIPNFPEQRQKRAPPATAEQFENNVDSMKNEVLWEK